MLTVIAKFTTTVHDASNASNASEQAVPEEQQEKLQHPPAKTFRLPRASVQ